MSTKASLRQRSLILGAMFAGSLMVPLMAGADAASTSSGSSSAEQADQASGKKSDDLQEVLVTAQRRSERLQDVPISISVLDGARLDTSSYQGTTEALTTVPGVAAFAGNQGGQTIIAVRGVAATAPLFAGASTVGYYLDGVPFGLVDSAILPDANAYDLQRVEVLRGPQGTLYGANALNGVVRVLTNDADLNNFDFKGRVLDSDTDGGGNNYRADMAINAPIVDGKVAVRAVAGYENLSGWIDSPVKDDINNAELQNYRLRVDGQPTDRLSIGLSSWFSRQRYGGLDIANDQEMTTHRLDEPIQTNFDSYGLKVGYQFTSISVVSNTSYLQYHTEDTLDFVNLLGPGTDYPLNSDFRSRNVAEEVNLSSLQDGPWRWTAGAMYRDAASQSYQSLPAIVTLDWTDTSKSYAVFGELSRRFLDRQLELTVGGRYFHDYVTTQEDPYVRPINGSEYYYSSDTFHATTPRAVLTWYPKQDEMIYGSFSEGFRSGSPQIYFITGGVPGFPAVQPDKLYNYEIGTKSELLDKLISVDTSLYYTRWKDIQQNLTVPLPGNPAVGVAALVNANSASGPGVDFGLTVRPVDRLEFTINVGWNDLTFDQNVISGGQILFAKGQRLNFSAKNVDGASATYAVPFGGSGYVGRFSVAATYTSSLSNTNLVGGAPVTTSGDNIVIARADFAIRAPSHWGVRLFADNITNNRGAVMGNPAYNETPEPVTYVRNRPRTIGLQFDYGYK